MVIETTGRIFAINYISDKSAQIVLKKQSRGKNVPIAINTYGRMKFDVDNMKLLKNEKVSVRFLLKSNLFKGKWYSDISMISILRVTVTKPFVEGKESVDLFNSESESLIPDQYFIDDETGELLL